MSWAEVKVLKDNLEPLYYHDKKVKRVNIIMLPKIKEGVHIDWVNTTGATYQGTIQSIYGDDSEVHMCFCLRTNSPYNHLVALIKFNPVDQTTTYMQDVYLYTSNPDLTKSDLSYIHTSQHSPIQYSTTDDGTFNIRPIKVGSKTKYLYLTWANDGYQYIGTNDYFGRNMFGKSSDGGGSVTLTVTQIPRPTAGYHTYKHLILKCDNHEDYLDIYSMSFLINNTFGWPVYIYKMRVSENDTITITDITTSINEELGISSNRCVPYAISKDKYLLTTFSVSGSKVMTEKYFQAKIVDVAADSVRELDGGELEAIKNAMKLNANGFSNGYVAPPHGVQNDILFLRDNILYYLVSNEDTSTPYLTVDGGLYQCLYYINEDTSWQMIDEHYTGITGKISPYYQPNNTYAYYNENGAYNVLNVIDANFDGQALSKRVNLYKEDIDNIVDLNEINLQLVTE